MKKRLLSLLAFCLVISSGLPCLNQSATSYSGFSAPDNKKRPADRLRAALEYHVFSEGLLMEKRFQNATGIGDRSDYCIGLIYEGRIGEAIRILENLENEKPGLFSIAANLGTAYELDGRNELALHWIQEGIRRNPADHEGTEWLHVKILEAKIAQQHDTNYFKTHSVLNLDASRIRSAPAPQIAGLKMSWDDLSKALYYQLGERLQFVKESDPCVASLLFDFAEIEAARNTLESATALLRMARKLGYPPALIDSRLAFYERRIRWHGLWLDSSPYVYFILAVTLTLFFLGQFKRWMRRRFPHIT